MKHQSPENRFTPAESCAFLLAITALAWTGIIALIMWVF